MTREKDDANAAERNAEEPAAIAEQQDELLRVLIRPLLEEAMEVKMAGAGRSQGCPGLDARYERVSEDARG